MTSFLVSTVAGFSICLNLAFLLLQIHLDTIFLSDCSFVIFCTPFPLQCFLNVYLIGLHRIKIFVTLSSTWNLIKYLFLIILILFFYAIFTSVNWHLTNKISTKLINLPTPSFSSNELKKFQLCIVGSLMKKSRRAEILAILSLYEWKCFIPGWAGCCLWGRGRPRLRPSWCSAWWARQSCRASRIPLAAAHAQNSYCKLSPNS